MRDPGINIRQRRSQILLRCHGGVAVWSEGWDPTLAERAIFGLHMTQIEGTELEPSEGSPSQGLNLHSRVTSPVLRWDWGPSLPFILAVVSYSSSSFLADWIESTEATHVPPYQKHSQPPPQSTSCHRVVHLVQSMNLHWHSVSTESMVTLDSILSVVHFGSLTNVWQLVATL